MWAMMAIFLNLFRSCLAMFFDRSHKSYRVLLVLYHSLPLVMRKRLVSVCHAMRVFFLLHGVSAVVSSVKDFGRQTIRHRFFASSSRIGNNPPDSKRTASFLVNFDWYLISRTTNA